MPNDKVDLEEAREHFSKSPPLFDSFWWMEASKNIGNRLITEVQTLRELVDELGKYSLILLQTMRQEEWAIAEKETREIRTKIAEMQKEVG